MIGMILNQPVDSIAVGVSGDRRGSQTGLEAPSPGPEEPCASCGVRIGHHAALCPWCGRAVLRDVLFDSEGAPGGHRSGSPVRELLAPGSSTLLSTPEGTSTWQ
jgi:hypothetical protein